MRREIEIQGELVKAVRSVDGFALKLANRYLVGVPDLLVKLPDDPPALFEMKVDKIPVRALFVQVTITALQFSWLRDAHRARMVCGVVSVVQDAKNFGVRILPVEHFMFENNASVAVSSYHIVVQGQRKAVMLREVGAYIRSWQWK